MDATIDAPTDVPVDERLLKTESEQEQAGRCFSRNARTRAALQLQADQKQRAWSCFGVQSVPAPPSIDRQVSDQGTSEDVFAELRQDTRLAPVEVPAATLELAPCDIVPEISVEPMVPEVSLVSETVSETAPEVAETLDEPEVEPETQLTTKSNKAEAGTEAGTEADTEAEPEIKAEVQSFANSWRDADAGKTKSTMTLCLCIFAFFMGLFLGMQLA